MVGSLKPDDPVAIRMHTQLGRALSAWAEVEYHLSLWFALATGISDHGMAHNVFFSARSFSGKADLLYAALIQPHTERPWADFLREAVRHAERWSDSRNLMAHGIIVGIEGEGTCGLSSPASMWRTPGISVGEMECAAINFGRLSYILHQAEWDYREDQWCRPSPQGRREELLLLPNMAFQREVSRNQQGRERQRRASRR